MWAWTRAAAREDLSPLFFDPLKISATEATCASLMFRGASGTLGMQHGAREPSANASDGLQNVRGRSCSEDRGAKKSVAWTPWATRRH
ncbi:hypothetical protein R1flu_001824 [Riccia fluitans]|uniref:Uncharacterized protein n=1 Tax=Riccia fluitans TaxID=41844 RepID=A0ABD1Y8D0_9MARC